MVDRPPLDGQATRTGSTEPPEPADPLAPVRRPRPPCRSSPETAAQAVARRRTASRSRSGINIAGMQVSRDRRGGHALVALAVDSAVPAEVLEEIRVTISAETARAIDL